MAVSSLVAALALLFELSAAYLGPAVGVKVAFIGADGEVQRWGAPASDPGHLVLDGAGRRIDVERSRQYGGLYSFRFVDSTGTPVVRAQAVDLSAAVEELFPEEDTDTRTIDPTLVITDSSNEVPQEQPQELLPEQSQEATDGILIFRQGETWICVLDGSVLVLTIVQ